jgi:hypothetical protein
LVITPFKIKPPQNIWPCRKPGGVSEGTTGAPQEELSNTLEEPYALNYTSEIEIH